MSPGVDRRALDLLRPPHQPEPAPLGRLACAVLERAMLDLRDQDAPQHVRDRARAFIASQSLDTWCEHTGLDPEALREKLLL
jgi:hypothetical protein